MAKATPEYQIITAYQSNDLENRINDEIKDGWTPLGGIVITSLSPVLVKKFEAYFYFAQAMVKP